MSCDTNEFNSITYGILSAMGGLGFFARLQKTKLQLTVNGLVWMILVNMQNFKLMAFLLLEI